MKTLSFLGKNDLQKDLSFVLLPQQLIFTTKFFVLLKKSKTFIFKMQGHKVILSFNCCDWL